MIIEFSVWRHTINKLALELIDQKVDAEYVIYFGQEEFQYPVFEGFLKAARYCYRKDIPFYIIHLSSEHVGPIHDVTRKVFSKVVPIYWGSFWFTMTYMSMWRPTRLDQPEVYKFPFVYLNGKAHYHRLQLIDKVYNAGLLDHGAVSWRGSIEVEPLHGFSWTPREMLLTDGLAGLNQSNPPAEYYESFIQLVPESNTEFACVSEKTIVPLMSKKPFLAFSAFGHHQLLEKLGFVLYTELFDYSFDTEPDPDLRAEMIVTELKKVVAMSQQDMKDMYQLLLPKLNHNYARAIEIATDPAYIPDLVMRHRNSPLCRPEAIDFILNNLPSSDPT